MDGPLTLALRPLGESAATLPAHVVVTETLWAAVPIADVRLYDQHLLEVSPHWPLGLLRGLFADAPVLHYAPRPADAEPFDDALVELFDVHPFVMPEYRPLLSWLSTPADTSAMTVGSLGSVRKDQESAAHVWLLPPGDEAPAAAARMTVEGLVHAVPRRRVDYLQLRCVAAEGRVVHLVDPASGTRACSLLPHDAPATPTARKAPALVGDSPDGVIDA